MMLISMIKNDHVMTPTYLASYFILVPRRNMSEGDFDDAEKNTVAERI